MSGWSGGDGQEALDVNLIGKTIGAGRYKVVSQIGEGGYGAVYLAEQLAMKRRVALKVINPSLAPTKELVQRFFREAEAASDLSHPNTVRYLDFWQDKKHLFLVMEFIEGQTLAKVLSRTGPMPVKRAVHIAVQLCGALAEAHAKGLVHRDLKPNNVIITRVGKDDNFVKLIDFGLAKTTSGPGKTMTDVTATGAILGTLAFMSPEQMHGHADARADIYAMGVILFVLLTGRKPFNADNDLAMIAQHLTWPAPPLRPLNPNIPPPLEAVVLRCLAKEKEARPQSTEDLAHLLIEAAGDLARPSLPPWLVNLDASPPQPTPATTPDPVTTRATEPLRAAGQAEHAAEDLQLREASEVVETPVRGAGARLALVMAAAQEAARHAEIPPTENWPEPVRPRVRRLALFILAAAFAVAFGGSVVYLLQDGSTPSSPVVGQSTESESDTSALPTWGEEVDTFRLAMAQAGETAAIAFPAQTAEPDTQGREIAGHVASQGSAWARTMADGETAAMARVSAESVTAFASRWLGAVSIGQSASGGVAQQGSSVAQGIAARGVMGISSGSGEGAVDMPTDY